MCSVVCNFSCNMLGESKKLIHIDMMDWELYIFVLYVLYMRLNENIFHYTESSLRFLLLVLNLNSK